MKILAQWADDYGSAGSESFRDKAEMISAILADGCADGDCNIREIEDSADAAWDSLAECSVGAFETVKYGDSGSRVRLTRVE